MRRFIICLILALTACIVSSCVHEEELQQDGKLPWSRPASWEGQTLGIPM